jgi:hypothetical protein
MNKEIHVLPKGDKWVVQSEREKDDAFFATQSDAEGYGRRVAREHRSGYYLHGPDGTVQRRDSYYDVHFNGR